MPRGPTEGAGEWWGTDEVREQVPRGRSVRSVHSAHGRRWREHRVVRLSELVHLWPAVERRALGLLETNEDRLRFLHA